MSEDDFVITPELIAEVEATASELKKHVDAALERVVASEPESTVAMAVSFMALTDFFGTEAHSISFAEFFVMFTELYKQLTR